MAIHLLYFILFIVSVLFVINILLIKTWNSIVNYKCWPKHDKIPAVIGMIPITGIIYSLVFIVLALNDKNHEISTTEFS